MGKEGLQAWYAKIDEYIYKLGLSKTYANSNLYFVIEKYGLLVLVQLVDDLIITRNFNQLISWCKKELASEFDIKDIGLSHYFWGLVVWHIVSEAFLGQKKYTLEILKRIQILDCKPISTPMVPNLKLACDEDSYLVDPILCKEPIGSLMYFVNNKPNICYAINTRSQFRVDPQQSHWKVGKHMLNYLNGTIHYGMQYARYGDLSLYGFDDLEWTKD
jgi:hypothetical protein